jgi:hypothetical protein
MRQVVDVRVDPATWIVETELESGINDARGRAAEHRSVGLADPQTAVIPIGTVIELGLECELLATENRFQRENMLQPA